MQTAIELLKRVMEVIESTDPDSDDFLDSGADSLEMLLDLEEEVCECIFEHTGAYPKRSRKKFDFDHYDVPSQFE